MAFEVRMKGFRDRTDVSELIRIIDERIGRLDEELVDIHVAQGCSLAKPVTSSVPVPAFARAAMDGYAVRGEDTFGASSYNEIRLNIVGEVLPGQECTIRVEPGQAVRIMTGAPVPAGADAVVMAENTREEGTDVLISEPIAPGKNVGQVGEDVRIGDTVLAPPRNLRPQDLAVCAAIGVSQLSVVRQPTVQIIVTGNELLPSGSQPQGHRIVDTNSIMLRALVERDGGVVLGERGKPLPILPDDRPLLEQTLAQSPADCLLISGGSSVGKEDHAPNVIAALGELAVHGLALRPASPAGLGFVSGRPVFLMPGNPVSCLCAYDLFAGRAIRRMAGRNPALPYASKTFVLERKISSLAGRVDYVRVRITDQQTVEPLAISGASILSSTTRADGFVLVPKDLEGYAAGATVEVWLY